MDPGKYLCFSLRPTAIGCLIALLVIHILFLTDLTGHGIKIYIQNSTTIAHDTGKYLNSFD